ncbi:MAG TPA: cupredoxin domain-containing protein [Dongiaceae bacterium]|jgi:hypothetical protein|nr:cupredoxin domain-containing protein [Dongiaceae bacterium]
MIWILACAAAMAEDIPAFVIEMRDGVATPQQLDVPARKTIKIIIRNTGTTPVEFESHELRKEKVVPPQSEGSLIIRSLAPGTYPFFDDFHPKGTRAFLVAK